MDDDRPIDRTTGLLQEFVRHVSEEVTVPPSPAAQQGRRRPHRGRGRRRALAIALATTAVVGATVLVVAYGPRSAPILPHLHPTSHPTLGSSATTPVVVDSCTVRQLTATVDFNQTGTDLGAIKLTNTSGRACSLSGQPQVMLLDGSGVVLDLNQSVFHQAPDWPAPSSPIVLSAARALPQAVVQLDWTWCGAPPGKVRFQIRFEGWPSPLMVANSDVFPPGFAPAGCTDSGGQPLLAVDYVRGFGRRGVVGPGPSPLSRAPVLGADAIGTVPMGTPETQAVAAIEVSLGRYSSTSPGVCPGRTEVEWGDLSLEFSSGRLDGYRYTTVGFAALGTATRPSGAPRPRLKTATGATLGMTLAQVRALYPPGAFTEEQGGAVVVPGATTGDRLFLGFFDNTPSTPLTEVKGGGPCGDV